jgi:autotransporter-associated beta strand protein
VVNHTGTITCQGGGTATTFIGANIGSNVTGITQNSATSVLVLDGTNNTFPGNTTINAGILRITQASDPLNANTGNDASTVTIAATDATLNLTYSGTDIVDKLFIGATQLAAGEYGPSATDIPQITGSGTLTVLTGPGGGFSSWITQEFANGTIPEVQRGANDDFDNDGISNLVEYAIAGQDPTVPNPSIGSFSAGLLSFSKRLDATGLSYAIEESTDLGIGDDWDEVGSYVTNDASTISHSMILGTPPSNFVRLKVTKTP